MEQSDEQGEGWKKKDAIKDGKKSKSDMQRRKLYVYLFHIKIIVNITIPLKRKEKLIR